MFLFFKVLRNFFEILSDFSRADGWNSVIFDAW